MASIALLVSMVKVCDSDVIHTFFMSSVLIRDVTSVWFQRGSNYERYQRRFSITAAGFIKAERKQLHIRWGHYAPRTSISLARRHNTEEDCDWFTQNLVSGPAAFPRSLFQIGLVSAGQGNKQWL